MADATVPINYPPGFARHDGLVIYKQMGISVSSALWVTGSENGPPTFRVLQCWEDGSETTGYFYLHELEAMAKAAQKYMDLQKEKE